MMKHILKSTFAILIILVTAGCTNNARETGSTFSQLFEEFPSRKFSGEELEGTTTIKTEELTLTSFRNGSFFAAEKADSLRQCGLLSPTVRYADGFTLAISNGDETDAWCLTDAVEVEHHSAGNAFTFSRDYLRVTRFDYIPDAGTGLIVHFLIRNEENETVILDLDFTTSVNLAPFGQNNASDGKDMAEWDPSRKLVVAKDERNPWFMVTGTDQQVLLSSQGSSPCPSTRNKNGLDAVLHSRIELGPSDEYPLYYFISGSTTDLAEALDTYRLISEDPTSLLRASDRKDLKE